SGVAARLRGVSAASEHVVWASGEKGTVLRTADGGARWTKLTVPDAAALDFRDVDAVSDSTAYLLSIGKGAASRIFKTTDAGAHWQTQFTNEDPGAFYDAMTFWDARRGLAISDSVNGSFVILTTRDGGATWTRVPAGGLPPALPNEGAFAGSGTNIAVAAGGHAWIGTGAAARSRVLRTADGGATWAIAETPLNASESAGIFSVAFRNPREGMTVGGDYQQERSAEKVAAIVGRGGTDGRGPLAGQRPELGADPGRGVSRLRVRAPRPRRLGRRRRRTDREVDVVIAQGATTGAPMETAMKRAALLVVGLIATTGPVVIAQGTQADYDRALGLRKKYESLVGNAAEAPRWIGRTHKLYYRRSVKGGHDFILVDADSKAKAPAFDHAAIATSLSSAAGKSYTALELPFNAFDFVDNERSIQFIAEGNTWRCEIATSSCRKATPAEAAQGGGRGGRGGGQGNAALAGRGRGDAAPTTRPSPDGTKEALIWNYNLQVRDASTGKNEVVLSNDGSEGDPYELNSIVWSPDSKKIAVNRVRPGYRREVHYVESSPADQLQPKHSVNVYAKPGDLLALPQPVIFDVATRHQVAIDNALFPNPYDLSRFQWRKDSSAVTFEYNQRGHQVFRVIEADAATGKARAVISEEPKTFFNYRTANGNLADSGKKYRFDVDDGKEVVWMSERDGWNHLYLYDGATGRMKNQITKGNWVVRAVQKVDESARQIIFSAGGMNAGKDPYFLNFYRVNFDGSGLTPLTTGDGNHNVVFSEDGNLYVDTWSRVDAP